jgi:hypothetical protein
VVEEPEEDIAGAGAAYVDFPVAETTTDDDALALLAESGLPVSGPGDEESEDQEASEVPGRGRRRGRHPVPA